MPAALAAFLRPGPPAPNPPPAERKPPTAAEAALARKVIEAARDAVSIFARAAKGRAPAAGDPLASLGRLDTAGAKVVLQAWFAARGLEPDRHGNWLVPPARAVRYKFKSRVLLKQRKSGGDWRTELSAQVIDAALDVVASLAEGVDDAAAAAARGAIEARSRATSGRAARAARDDVRRRARVLAVKWAAAADPEGAEAWADVVGSEWDQATHRVATAGGSGGAAAERFRRALLDAEPTYRAQLDAGASDPPDDSAFASARNPPWLPTLCEGLSYRWTERVDGVAYTVRVADEDDGVAVVYVGRSEGLGVNPHTKEVVEERDVDVEGDGYVAGVLSRGRDGRRSATLYMIKSRVRRSGAGARAMRVWCRLMAGYGIRVFRIQAVGPEGRAFFARLAARGDLVVREVEGSSDVLASCAAEPPAGQLAL